MSAVTWNQLPEVRSPAGRTAADLLAEGLRRQPLPAFEPVYRNIGDFIVRCTHRIWGQKDIGLCRTHYADSCVMHTLNGPSCGVETVVQGTLSALSAFADRQVVAEDVIWSEDAPGLFYSSHRITSRSTHEGVDALYGAGAASQADWGAYRLTPVQQDTAPMIEATVQMLLQQLEDDAVTRDHVVVPTRLVVRSSARQPT